MTHDREPHREVAVHYSADPAIDREAMGADFTRHFGDVTLAGEPTRFGTREPGLVKMRAGMVASTFTIRALTVQQLRVAKSAREFEDKCLRALMFAIVRAEVSPPLASHAVLWQPSLATGAEMIEPKQLDELCAMVGDDALVEIGSVALQRAVVRPFSVPHYLLPAGSVLDQMRVLHSLAVTRASEKSDTSSTGEQPHTEADTPPA